MSLFWFSLITLSDTLASATTQERRANEHAGAGRKLSGLKERIYHLGDPIFANAFGGIAVMLLLLKSRMSLGYVAPVHVPMRSRARTLPIFLPPHMQHVLGLKLVKSMADFSSGVGAGCKFGVQ